MLEGRFAAAIASLHGLEPPMCSAPRCSCCQGARVLSCHESLGVCMDQQPDCKCSCVAACSCGGLDCSFSAAWPRHRHKQTTAAVPGCDRQLHSSILAGAWPAAGLLLVVVTPRLLPTRAATDARDKLSIQLEQHVLFHCMVSVMTFLLRCHNRTRPSAGSSSSSRKSC